MHIANPIYDVVFKYMLEDNKVARLLLSAVIGEQIVELDFSAEQKVEHVERPTDDRTPLTVCRFDFVAKVKTQTGFKTISIELQKAKLQSDLMRFRRYLGAHYQNPDNTHLVPAKKRKNQKHDMLEKPRQIYCIYFLDYGMDLPKRPVLKVDYKVEDVYNGEEFPASGEFVTGLHHCSWIVQIRQLKKNRRNRLEEILSVFDQSNMTDHRHILDVDDESYPEEYREIIRRLRKAMEDPKKRREMELEDDIIKELQDLERKIENMGHTIAEKNNALAEQEKVIAELRKQLSKNQ